MSGVPRFVAGRGRYGSICVRDLARGNRMAVGVPRDLGHYASDKADAVALRIAEICAVALNREHEARLAAQQEGGK